MQTGKIYNEHAQHHDDHHGQAEDNNTQPCSTARSLLTQDMYTRIFGGTPTRGATIGAERKEFIWWTERAITIIVRTYFIANLFAFKNSVAVRAAQKQVLSPIAGVAGRTAIIPTSCFSMRPTVMTAMTMVRFLMCRRGRYAIQYARLYSQAA